MRGLAAEPYWHRLLHYRPDHFGGGVTSVIDDARFFLAADGKHDPEAELAAALAGFFGTETRQDEPLQCRFRARFEWLRAQLSFDPARLPPQPCPLYDEWRATLDASSLSLVFASNDLNSPATMYGHTLLRIDSRQRPDAPLLSAAVNYAAVVTHEQPLLYMAQGVLGGFVGQFGINPYHEKVRQYARINHRDLWEYPLQLTAAEIDRVLAHLWELRGVGASYFFFSENCSYMLLGLVQTARPGLTLTANFERLAPYTIPSDTLRTLRDAGLLGEPVFRPSLARRLQHRLAHLDATQREWVLEYAGGDAALTDARLTRADARGRARMLEVASDYLFFRYHAEEASREEALPRSFAAMRARSEEAAPAEFGDVPVPRTSPERGHETARLALGARVDRHDAAAVLRARAAYHDRLDPPAGYLAGGELEFFEIGALVWDDGAALSDFTLVNVAAVSPWDRAFRPWSWQVAGGARRYGLDALAARPQHALGGYVDAGAGAALEPAPGVFVYGLAVAEIDVNRDVPSGHALAAGGRLGGAASWGGRFMLEAEVERLEPVDGGAAQLGAEFGVQYQLAAHHGVRLGGTWRSHGEAETHSADLRWVRYF